MYRVLWLDPNLSQPTNIISKWQKWRLQHLQGILLYHNQDCFQSRYRWDPLYPCHKGKCLRIPKGFYPSRSGNHWEEPQNPRMQEKMLMYRRQDLTFRRHKLWSDRLGQKHQGSPIVPSNMCVLDKGNEVLKQAILPFQICNSKHVRIQKLMKERGKSSLVVKPIVEEWWKIG